MSGEASSFLVLKNPTTGADGSAKKPSFLNISYKNILSTKIGLLHSKSKFTRNLQEIQKMVLNFYLKLIGKENKEGHFLTNTIFLDM